MNVVPVQEFLGRCKSTSVFAICPSHVAFVEGKDGFLQALNNVKENESTEEVDLKGHHSPISAMEFSSFMADGFTLVTGAADYLIAWNLNEVSVNFNNGELVRGHVLLSLHEAPHGICISDDFEMICALSQTSFIVCARVTKQIVLEERAKDLVCVKFLSQSELITAKYNGNIALWDVPHRNLLWEISAINGYSLTSLATSANSDQFSVGSSIATVQQFAYGGKKQQHKEFVKIDLDESLMRMFPEWKQTGSGDDSRGNVIALCYITLQFQDVNCDNSSSHEVFLLCATERAIFAINRDNQEIMARGYYGDEIGPPVVSHAYFVHDGTNQKIYCLASRMFEEKFVLFSIAIPNPESKATISFISSAPLDPSSLLKSQSKLTKPSKPTNDKSITFKSKVKSSGYTTAPRMTMFKPQTSYKKTTVKSKPSLSRFPSRVSSAAPDWLKDIETQQLYPLTSKSCNINCISINDKNQYISCALGDATAHVSRLPLPSNSEKFKVITGHNKAVIGCSWSHDKDVLLTYSSDGDVKLWSPPHTGDPVLSFPILNMEKIHRDLTHAQFYYLDKFLLASLGNSLHLYKYALQEGTKDDVKRYLNQSKQKLVGTWPMTSARSITCLASPNNFYSYIILSCGSDRSLEVRDMNVSKLIHRFKDVHTRPAHAIRLSVETSQLSTGSRDLFVTSAASDGMKLWDLRTQRCCRKFNCHSCICKCDVTMSSCGNFICTSTDDKTICVYDVRKTFPVHVIKQKEKVSAVTFTPDSNQIIVGLESSKLVSVKTI
ncbi:WD repeat-containing protein 27-like [Clavelina lepadiformis]|uniref:WD repeat-containing protein 27-like n=1 Tax=Clavelina lepadiformis TaxID=159417 RepID=UPI00404295B6